MTAFNETGRVKTRLVKDNLICDTYPCKNPAEFVLEDGNRFDGENYENMGQYCSLHAGTKEHALHKAEEFRLNQLAIQLKKSVESLTKDEIFDTVQPEEILPPVEDKKEEDKKEVPIGGLL